MITTVEEKKIIARTLVGAFGGTPHVVKFWDDSKKNAVDILISLDSPQVGFTSYGTVSLSDAPLYQDGIEYSARLEILGICDSASINFPNILATAAFCIISSKWFCFPGAIFPDILSMYDASSTMRHLLFVPPFLWEEKIKTLSLKAKTVTWLLAVPISDAECNFANLNGVAALENKFSEVQIDIFDLNRTSIF